MFAKLRENKFFKSLSQILCSIELIEEQGKTPTSCPNFHIHSFSLMEGDATPYELCKTRQDDKNTHHNHRFPADSQSPQNLMK
jgi:hypothetical protein